MNPRHDSSFQDRIASAASAKKKALEKLRAKPPVDEKVLAERQAARLKREAAEAAKRAAKAEAQQAVRDAKAAAEQAEREAQEAAAAKAAAKPALPTQAELKAARDARYAARKAR